MAQNEAIIIDSDESDDDSIVERTDESLQCSSRMAPDDHAILHSKRWLNDKIITNYFDLLKREMEGKENLRVEVINSQVVEKMVRHGVDAATNYYRKVKFLSADYILVPINHLGCHWTLGVIHVATQSIQYYDSYKSTDSPYSEMLCKFLLSRSKKEKQEIPSSWSSAVVDNIPTQQNSYDCGAFVLEYARSVLLGIPMTFTERDMPEIRKRISRELKANKLMQATLKPTVCLHGKMTHSSKTLTKQGEDTDTRDSDKVPSLTAPGLAQPPSQQPSNKPIQWKDLNASLKQVLPPDEQYTYVIETYQESSECQEDAPQFSATIRINLQNETEARDWITQMSNHSKCTYRVTKTVKPGMKRVKCKLVMHCQHFAKKLTEKQREKSALARAKKTKAPLRLQLRNKKTDCPSNFVLVVQIPSKTQTRQSESKPYLLTHCGVFKVEFVHNHPVYAAHTLSFRDVSEHTKEKLFDLFEMGHNASSARHAHEQQLLAEAESPEDQQNIFADRAKTPNLQDMFRLYDKWRVSTCGEENGKGMIQKLQEAVDSYNEQFSKEGGKALLQWYDAGVDAQELESDTEDFEPPKKKKKKDTNTNPLILALCTPLMSRAHQFVQQSSDIVFCDATSSFDRYNMSLFLLSTTTPAGAVPLGAIVTSDEKEATIAQGMQMLKSILPENAFFGEGSERGPSVIMTDDSSPERDALSKAWQSATLLLCTFHFLQRRWTWLWDAKNGIHSKEDRSFLIKELKKLVYAETEEQLNHLYSAMQNCPVANKHPNYLHHIQALWPRRREWAHSYRKHILIRGNHTNNFAEAGMKILTEIVFSRVKAYNLVQVFHFLAETLESYYCRKLLSVSNNRLETYIALRFQGLNAKKVPKESIEEVDKGKFYHVKSTSQRGVAYVVDMMVGVCTCPQGIDGSPCTHQAAIAIHYGTPSINCIPTLAPQIRRIYAQIALGREAVTNLSFYAGLHDRMEDIMKNEENDQCMHPDFSTPAWDLIRAGSQDMSDSGNDTSSSTSPSRDAANIRNMCTAIDSIAEDLKQKLQEDNEQLVFGAEKFISRYNSNTAYHC